MAKRRKKGAKARAERELERVRDRAVREAAQPSPQEPDADEDAHYPCPADGATLYGWTSAKHWDGSEPTLLDSCEECGLAVSRAPAPPDPAAELATLERDGEELLVANLGSWAAWLGAGAWADLDAEGRRLHMTKKALQLLLAKQGVEVLRMRTPFSLRGYAGMLQTMINAFTLRRNFARRFRAGTLEPKTTRDRFAIALDGVVTVLVAVPLSLAALLTEALAALTGHGGLIRAQTAPTAVSTEP